MTVWTQIRDLVTEAGACALVTVAEARGSAPREQGARMIVGADGSIYGTIGGGTLEFEAFKWARQNLAGNIKGLQQRPVSLGPDLGQCCGGRVTVAIEILNRAQLPQIDLFAELEAKGTPFATRAVVHEGEPVQRVLEPSAEGVETFTFDGTVLVERFGETIRPVWLFGAGHVGRAVVLALAPLPFQVTWIDSRSDMFPKEIPGELLCVACDRPATLIADAPSDAFIVVMTHSHALDEDIAAAALSENRFAYVGMIGSDTKRSRFISRLRKRGLSAETVNRLICPIGSSGLRSKLPPVIAAGLAVELIAADEAARYGHVRIQNLPGFSDTCH